MIKKNMENLLDNIEVESESISSNTIWNIKEPVPRKIDDVFSEFKKGKLFLQPEFQRDFIWPKTKQKELIKSIWRNIPLPMFYFSINNRSNQEVIDGQQRLTTIFGYLNADKINPGIKPKLVKKVNIKDSNNILVSKKQVIDKIKFSRIYCVEIEEKGMSINDKFEIFRSLNQGAVPLKIQEIRNAIYHRDNPYLNSALKSLAKRLEKLLSMKNTRMIFEDLVLRFFIINERGYAKKVSQQLKNHKDIIDSFPQSKVNKCSADYNYFLKKMGSWFGNKSFQVLAINSTNPKISNKEWGKFVFSNKINQGLFHLFSHYLPLYARNKLNVNKNQIRKKYIELLKTPKFINLITGSGTDSTNKIVQSKIIFEKHFLIPCFGDWTKKEKRNVSKAFKKTLLENIPYCYLCYGKLKKFESLGTFISVHGEHIKPFSTKKNTSSNNILLAHSICNHKKSSSPLEEYRNTNYSIRKRKKYINNINSYLNRLKNWNKDYPLKDYKNLVIYAKKDIKL
jgi:uncharacterized protein with ParB-like and HNH nuclease domain